MSSRATGAGAGWRTAVSRAPAADVPSLPVPKRARVPSGSGSRRPPVRGHVPRPAPAVLVAHDDDRPRPRELRARGAADLPRSDRAGTARGGPGAGPAGSLYATFAVGDRFARRFVPSGERDIAEIYALRGLRPAPEIAARLATVIGPAEEVFWRGFVQDALMARLGRWPGAAAAAMAYGGVHIVTGNFTLFGAAGVAGAQWCALYAAGMPLGALLVSHV